MRRCVDCEADISHRGRSAYLCLSCVRTRHLEHDRRWHHEHPESGRASERRQRAKRPRPKCRACGASRGRWRTYCDPCRVAFREVTHVLARKKYLKRLRDQSNTVEHVDFVTGIISSSSKSKGKLLTQLKLKDLPLDTEWWNARRVQFPGVDLHDELSKAQDWYKADKVKSPKLFFRNWLERASRSQPARELTPEEARARLRVVS